METPDVSVVMPVWNRERFVAESIRSVLAQTFDRFELIVVDDGSTDASADVVTGFTDARLRFFRRDHRGISASLNFGLQQARGSCYARLDSDDLWAPQFLDRMLRTKHVTGADVVYARARAIDADGEPLAEERGWPLSDPSDPHVSMLLADATCNIALVATTVAVREVGGFDEAMACNEDWDLWLRVSRTHTFRFLDEVLASYRLHGANITRIQRVSSLQSRVSVLDKAFASAPSPRMLSVRSHCYRNLYLGSGMAHWAWGDRRAAWRSFGKAFASSADWPGTVAKLARAMTSLYLRTTPGLGGVHRLLWRSRQRFHDRVRAGRAH